MHSIKILIFSVLLILFTSGLKAQIRIDNSEVSFEKNLRPCLGAMVESEPKVLKKAWYKYLKKNHDVKLNGNGLFSDRDFLVGIDVTIATVSTKRMNFYTRLIETPTGSEMKVFASFGYDIFVGTTNYPKEFEAIKGIMNNFLIEYLNEYYNDEIKATTKIIKSLSKEKGSLEKSVDKNDREIKKLTKSIASLNSVKNPNSEDAIKATEQLNRLPAEKLKLQNENNKNNIEIKNIEDKLVLRKEKLEKLKAKYQN